LLLLQQRFQYRRIIGEFSRQPIHGPKV
jgi:hypothetical protein